MTAASAPHRHVFLEGQGVSGLHRFFARIREIRGGAQLQDLVLRLLFPCSVVIVSSFRGDLKCEGLCDAGVTASLQAVSALGASGARTEGGRYPWT